MRRTCAQLVDLRLGVALGQAPWAPIDIPEKDTCGTQRLVAVDVLAKQPGVAGGGPGRAPFKVHRVLAVVVRIHRHAELEHCGNFCAKTRVSPRVCCPRKLLAPVVGAQDRWSAATASRVVSASTPPLLRCGKRSIPLRLVFLSGRDFDN
jgi:hypothetical protein